MIDQEIDEIDPDIFRLSSTDEKLETIRRKLNALICELGKHLAMQEKCSCVKGGNLTCPVHTKVVDYKPEKIDTKWQPKEDEDFWFINFDEGFWVVEKGLWTNNWMQIRRFADGNAFHTQDEAEAMRDKIKALLFEERND